MYFAGFLSVLYVFRRSAGRDEEWKELILNKQSGNRQFPDCSMFGLFSVFYLSMSSASLAFTSSPRRFLATMVPSGPMRKLEGMLWMAYAS